MDHVQRSKSTSRSPSITMRKAYLENSVMYTEISRCIFQGSPGDSLRETEVRGPAYYPGQKLAKNVLNLMDRGKQRWGRGGAAPALTSPLRRSSPRGEAAGISEASLRRGRGTRSTW